MLASDIIEMVVMLESTSAGYSAILALLLTVHSCYVHNIAPVLLFRILDAVTIPSFCPGVHQNFLTEKKMKIGHVRLLALGCGFNGTQIDLFRFMAIS